MSTSSNLHRRVISQDHYDRLTPGLKRLAKGHKWLVVPQPDPTDRRVITLADLGREPRPVPQIANQALPSASPVVSPLRVDLTQQVDEDRLPTIEEYVNTGYPVHLYGEFIEREKSYREVRRRQAAEAAIEAQRTMVSKDASDETK